MRVLIAPDSFKESLSSIQAAEAMAAGVRAAGAEADLLPVADGGQGSLAAILAACGGERRSLRATGPLGETVEAAWGLLPNRSRDTGLGPSRIGLIEMAQASGLELVSAERRDPLRATSRGTGELLAAALDAGCEDLLLCIGGSATVDGGAGCMAALGLVLFDAQGDPIDAGAGPAALALATSLDASGLHPALKQARIRIACDVTNPLLGPRGAARTYGSQKGATPEQVELLERLLAHWAGLLEGAGGKDVRDLSGAGAAGGIATGLAAFAGAELVRGIDTVLDLAGFDARASGADLVLTGEGRLDHQSLSGKTAQGVARRAAALGLPTVALAGSVDLDGPGLERAGLAAAYALLEGSMTLNECKARAPELLAAAAERAVRVFAAGKRGRNMRYEI